MRRITDYITGQMSDGIGEVLEQTALITDDGEIYAHLWQDSDWKLMSQDEFDRLSHSESHKPDAPMIGADGNIFSQMAIAKKVLIANGQDYVANEMMERVMESDSYDSALRVICEYVNPVDKKEYNRNRYKKSKPKER